MLTSSSRKLFIPFLKRTSTVSSLHSMTSSTLLSLSSSTSTSRLLNSITRRCLSSNGMKTRHEWDEEIKQALSRNSHEALVLIQKGCDSGQLTLSEEQFRLYQKLAVTHNVNINLPAAVQSYINGLNGTATVAGGAGTAGLGQGMPVMNSAFAAAGLSQTNPLHVVVKGPTFGQTLLNLFLKGAGFLIILTIIMAIFDEKNVGGGLTSRMTGSAAHRAENSDKTFDDVVGVDEAKEELQEIVQYLKDPKKFTRLGGKLPKGVLLTGPPGTGKTLLAKAVAGEAGVRFLYSSGSEFEEMFVGVGAKRVRELFQQAGEESPCIIFIDEIDAIGGTRQLKDQSAMKMTLNQLLVEMDGFKENSGIIVIAATNFPESLDAALTRPGRIDKHVNVSLPDVGGRKAILEHYGKKVPSAPDVDFEQIARGTPGFSGAQLSNLVNEAAIRAAVKNLSAVDMATFEYAKDKIMMGSERQSAVISKETMQMTAYHEAGHALISLLTDGADPIHKATIMPRGRALGMVMQLPDGDQTSMSRKQMLAKLDICMGGRIAEEMIFGEDNVTSGATGDFQQATRLARAMITKWGFSQKLGVQYLDDKEKFSGETQSIIDSEVRRLLDESYSRAKTLLQTHKKELALVAEALMEHETLSGSEVADVVKGKALNLRIRSQKASRDPKPIPEQKKKKPILPSPAAAGVPVVKPGVPKPTVPATASTKAPVAAVVPATVASPATAAATENVAVQSQTEKKAPSTAPIRGPPVTPKSS